MGVKEKTKIIYILMGRVFMLIALALEIVVFLLQSTPDHSTGFWVPYVISVLIDTGCITLASECISRHGPIDSRTILVVLAASLTFAIFVFHFSNELHAVFYPRTILPGLLMINSGGVFLFGIGLLISGRSYGERISTTA